MTVFLDRGNYAQTRKSNLVYRQANVINANPNIVVPSDVGNRIKYTLFHEAESILLLDFGIQPTLSNYGLALPANVVYVEYDFAGQVWGISSDGSDIKVIVREFYP